MGIVALVLAAGKSSRMGSDKLSMRLHAVEEEATSDRIQSSEESFSPSMTAAAKTKNATVGGQVLSVLLQVSELSSVVVVHAPHSSPAWQAQCQHLQDLHPERMQLIACDDAELGMSYSIRCGVQYIREHLQEPEAIMIVLADQPLLEPVHIRQVATHWLEHSELDYVAAAGQAGAAPPIIFAVSVWARLEQLSGDQGARRLLKDASLHGAHVELPEYCFWDADTPAALERIQQYIVEQRKRGIEDDEKA
jgi:molybdenum cofactor cytidylyltransferase